MSTSRTLPRRARGFSLVEALLAIAILAAAMLVASQGVMATTNGKLAVHRSREIRQWHTDRMLQFQYGARLTDALPGKLPTVTATTASGYAVSVEEEITLHSPTLAVLVSQATWTVPGAGAISETLTGLQARP